MKTLLLAACLAALPGGDREEGLRLYREGRFAEAAAAFRAALAEEGDAADLQWNLALASWRAGDLAAAETAAETYAALAAAPRIDLHRGLLGAVRFGEAQRLEAEADALHDGGGAPPTAPDAEPADPLPVLEQALRKAEQARDHFVAGAAAKGSPELLRNTERALRYVEALRAKLEQWRKEREQQEGDEQQQDDQKQEGDQPQEGDQQQGDQPQDGEPQDGEPQDGEPQQEQAPPEPQPSEPQPSEQQPEPQTEPEPREAAEPRDDAPGEAAEGRALPPEQAQRLLERLKQLDARLQQLRERDAQRRRPVERDW